MTPYIILLFTIIFIAYTGRLYGGRLGQFFSLVVITLSLSLFAGIRNETVGSDTHTYVSLFMRFNSFDDIWRTQEYAYNALVVIASSISNNYAALLILTALIVVSCYVLTILRLTKRYETALFLFITLGSYTFFFNGARQGIAASICFFAIPWLLDRKPKQYFILIALAFLFHNTALVAVPLYFLAAPRIGLRQIFSVIVGAVVFSLFLSVFVGLAAELLDDKYAAYADASDGGGGVTAAFLIIQGILLYLLRPNTLECNGKYQRLLNIYLIGFIPIIAAMVTNVNPSGLLRLHLYFSSTAILLWPMVFMSWKDSPKRALVSLSFFIFIFIYFLITVSTFSSLTPYKINSSIF